jgi:hypothetical protein
VERIKGSPFSSSIGGRDSLEINLASDLIRVRVLFLLFLFFDFAFIYSTEKNSVVQSFMIPITNINL